MVFPGPAGINKSLVIGFWAVKIVAPFGGGAR